MQFIAPRALFLRRMSPPSASGEKALLRGPPGPSSLLLHHVLRLPSPSPAAPAQSTTALLGRRSSRETPPGGLPGGSKGGLSGKLHALALAGAGREYKESRAVLELAATVRLRVSSPQAARHHTPLTAQPSLATAVVMAAR